ncbi:MULTISPECIES: SDR family NAD(P)-dependent oxidoreductase [Brevibacterium]|uniref:SDR family NAD(P)-dependent oxidoreductase n=1 Tax=Brevibacterium salitolerans TaxID=1403566 RepID=A0ABN2WD33_9MICO|nr:SDR family NAD(P)-dependent oxidoreductase [Brevibacterium sp.]
MLSFEGKVALVTGAGQGLGRSHALELAGGTAAVSRGDVTQDAEAIVRTALDEFGRLDVVVDNAGVNTPKAFGPGIEEEVRRHMEVNYLGTVAVTAAAWPHLAASGAGRVVSTTSPTIVGWEGQVPYVVSKAAVFAFTRTLAMEGLAQGIKVNAIAPTAYTPMAAAAELPEELKENLRANMTTEMVSPFVAYLAHADCEVTGESFLTQGGLMQRITLAVNDGYANPQTTAEDIQAHLATILDDATSTPLGRIGTEDAGSLLDMLGS